jgi:hypothetical protein
MINLECNAEVNKLNEFIKDHDLNITRSQKSFSYSSNPIGNTYNKWTVLDKACSNKHGASMYLCKCECGNECIVKGVSLFNGLSTRCRLCSSYSLHSGNSFLMREKYNHD